MGKIAYSEPLNYAICDMLRDIWRLNRPLPSDATKPINLVTYSQASLDRLKADIRLYELFDFRPLPRSYKSIWRVLHVDGFENRKICFDFETRRNQRLGMPADACGFTGWEEES